ncbi:unnamed protein product [Closterium sp. NIES-53]
MPPAIWMTLYLLATHLPDRFAPARDQFLTINPMTLTIYLFEKRLFAIEHLARSLATATSTVLPPIFEGCAPRGARRVARKEEVVVAVREVVGVVVEGVEGVEGVEVAVEAEVVEEAAVEEEAVEEEIVGRPKQQPQQQQLQQPQRQQQFQGPR